MVREPSGTGATPSSHGPRGWTREELIYQLTIAAELEHSLACMYMFAAFSLKDREDEGLRPERVATVRRWKKSILSVAVEEMLHLSQVSNLLASIGWSPHFTRPNFPQPDTAYPFALALELEPFSRRTLERFLRLELPQAESANEPTPHPGPRDGIEPFAPSFSTIGELYATIRGGFEQLPEAELFIGRPRAQTSGKRVHFESALSEIRDRKSALAAIDMIVEQGEAATREHPDAHFQVFQSILGELDGMAGDAESALVRPVVSNPLPRQRHGASAGAVIGQRLTHAVAELANFAYETLILVLVRFFSHLDDSEADRDLLGSTALRLMTHVISPFGELLAQLPFGESRDAGTAGISFGISRTVQLLPARGAAFCIIAERLERIAEYAPDIDAKRLAAVSAECCNLSRSVRAIAN